LSFGTTTAFDYVAFPAAVQADFAAPLAPLIAGPAGGVLGGPVIPPDTVSGIELETNIILLNMNYSQFALNAGASMSGNVWNWLEVGTTTTHRFICWEPIPINVIDPRITFLGPFGANYGQIRFTPTPSSGPSAPAILGSIEQVADIGRTIRNLIHSSTAASPTIYITDIE